MVEKTNQCLLGTLDLLLLPEPNSHLISQKRVVLHQLQIPQDQQVAALRLFDQQDQ